MNNKDKTKEQLINELEELHQQITKLKSLETKRRRTEERIQEGEQRFRSLVETINDWVWEVDVNSTYTYSSPKVKDLLGHEPEEVIGKTPFDLMPAHEAERVAGLFRDIIESRKPFAGLVNTNLHKDGRHVVLETSGVPIFDTSGNLLGYRGIDRDITERKKAEKEIKEGKEFLESVLESSMDGIAIVDDKGYIISLNTALEKMCKFAKEELIGKHISILTIEDKDLREKVIKKTKELFEKGFTRFEAVNKTKDGNYINVECNNSLIKDARGDIIAGVSIIRDITDRKNADKKIRETRDFLENIFKTSADGMIVTDSKGHLTMANTAAEKMVGHSQDELIGKHLVELLPKGIKHKEKGKGYQKRLEEKGSIRGIEFVWARKDGSLFDVDINASLLKNNEGNLTGVVATIRDISERKKVEKRLVEHQGQLKSLASQITLSEEKERRRFADYLHGQIGQSLFISKLKLEGLQWNLWVKATEQLITR